MSTPSGAKILVLAQDHSTATAWGDLLRQSGATAWLSPAEVPPGEAVEVLLTDLPTIDEAVAGAAPLVGKQAARQRTLGNLGVVAVGPADWADANLAADFTPRELALACGLAARLARSRSQRSELAELHDATQRLAQTDPLTGLANRREWDEQLSARWSLARRSGKRVWLALVDLDRFKGFNDRHGMRRRRAAAGRRQRIGSRIARPGPDCPAGRRRVRCTGFGRGRSRGRPHFRAALRGSEIAQRTRRFPSFGQHWLRRQHD